MARRPKRRFKRKSMGKYIRGGINEELSLSTLAAQTLVSVVFDNVVNERTFVSSIDASYSLFNFTPASGDGPVLVGVAHSDYTDAEIQAVIDATLSWNEGDLIAQEIAHRKVRRIGIFEIPDDATDAVTLNEGRSIKTRLNWTLLQGQSLRMWAFNMGSSAFATTAPNVQAEGHANLWLR